MGAKTHILQRPVSAARDEQPSHSMLIRRYSPRMNTKLHAVTDENGRPISLLMTAGQISDYTCPPTVG